MRVFFIIIFFISTISCKDNTQNKLPEKFNPYEHLNHNIENEKAREFYFKGLDFYDQSDLESAKESFTKSFEIEKSPITINELGWIEFTKKDYTKAIIYFKQARNLDNSYWPAYINEAKCFRNLNNFIEAENILLKLKELSESEYWNSYADFGLAIIYFDDKQGFISNLSVLDLLFNEGTNALDYLHSHNGLIIDHY